MTKFSFKVGMWPVRLYVSVSDDMKATAHSYGIKDRDYLFEGAGACYIAYTGGPVFLFFKSTNSIVQISHEISHAVDQILEIAGVDRADTETRAYTTDYITGKILKKWPAKLRKNLIKI